MMLKAYRFTVRTHGTTRRIVTAESGEKQNTQRMSRSAGA